MHLSSSLLGTGSPTGYAAWRWLATFSTSDLDFLIEFAPCWAAEHYERYFDLLDELRTLFQRDIDLVEARTMRNPYFIRRVNETRAPIYTA
jgi:predicted nucleotidyltransferase